ncbi:hypothetical protein Nepgr_008019 [Nepenthes gracilis]|uniref:Uncharacterized protein n=1 Tax=Nepenthes gracilis TaxID=150966 RepID=A0AAD3XIW0_NEPGR|nr:hypothetical protein Nepgr_008019 [Nepenthes gracilis]
MADSMADFSVAFCVGTGGCLQAVCRGWKIGPVFLMGFRRHFLLLFRCYVSRLPVLVVTVSQGTIEEVKAAGGAQMVWTLLSEQIWSLQWLRDRSSIVFRLVDRHADEMGLYTATSRQMFYRLESDADVAASLVEIEVAYHGKPVHQLKGRDADLGIKPAVVKSESPRQENGDVELVQPAAEPLCDSHPLPSSLKPAIEVCELSPAQLLMLLLGQQEKQDPNPILAVKIGKRFSFRRAPSSTCFNRIPTSRNKILAAFMQGNRIRTWQDQEPNTASFSGFRMEQTKVIEDISLQRRQHRAKT